MADLRHCSLVPIAKPDTPASVTAEIAAPEARHLRPRESLAALAKRIRTLRERQGLTQEDFAQKSGISVSFASLLERGERSPSYETLIQVAGALGVPMPELFRDLSGNSYDDPYFSRLTDFARRARLTRAQVDRLLAVATAMFDIPPATGRGDGAARARSHSVCSEEGCGKAVLARGLCASHYHRARRARIV